MGESVRTVSVVLHDGLAQTVCTGVQADDGGGWFDGQTRAGSSRGGCNGAEGCGGLGHCCIWCIWCIWCIQHIWCIRIASVVHLVSTNPPSQPSSPMGRTCRRCTTHLHRRRQIHCPTAGRGVLSVRDSLRRCRVGEITGDVAFALLCVAEPTFECLA